MNPSETPRDIAFPGAVMGAGWLMKRGVEKSWEKRSSRPPPKHPAAPEVACLEALSRAAIAGVAVGVTRTAARRLLAAHLDGHRTPTGWERP